MQVEDYQNRLARIRAEAQQKEMDLAIEFAKSNSPYQVGDVVTDHIGTIQIIKIKYGYSSSNSLPCAIYLGVELKRDGSKKKSERMVYQTNVIKPQKSFLTTKNNPL